MSHRSELGFNFVPESGLWLGDNTIGDVSTSRHGFVPKLPGTTTTFLRGDGTWAAPVGGGSTVLPVEIDITRHIWGQDLPVFQATYQSVAIHAMNNGGSTTPAPVDATDDRGRGVKHETAASAGAFQLRRTNTGGGNFAQLRRAWQPIVGGAVTLGSAITSYRVWLGCMSGEAAAAANPTDPSGFHLAAFRFDTSTDTNWTGITKDGTTLHAEDTGVTPAADTTYRWVIDMSDLTQVDFYLNGSLVATSTSNLPTTSNWMCICISVSALAASARYIINRGFWFRHNLVT